MTGAPTKDGRRIKHPMDVQRLANFLGGSVERLSPDSPLMIGLGDADDTWVTPEWSWTFAGLLMDRAAQLGYEPTVGQRVDGRWECAMHMQNKGIEDAVVRIDVSAPAVIIAQCLNSPAGEL